MSQRKCAKVLVIGLDGADWRLLAPWIEHGHLPTLAQLVAEGTSGKLRSTIRPESSVAWSTFATGVNPGKHGIYGFVANKPGSYAYELTNGSSLRAPCSWDHLGRGGYQVGLINVPFTYPPPVVNGFVVSGMLTPNLDVNFTYPPELKDSLMRRFNGYRLDPSEAMQDKAILQEAVRAYSEQQRDTALALLRDREWDFCTLVFTGPDRLQHVFWADAEREQAPSAGPASAKHGTVLLDHFRLLDAAIAQILDQLPADTLVIIMSDHGFNGVSRRFYVNRWLYRQGYLKISSGANRRSALLAQLSRLKSVPALRRLKRMLIPGDLGPAQMRVAMFGQAISWKQSKVYYAPDGGLRINLQGRDPAGIVAPGEEYEALCRELRASLSQIVDPQTGRVPIDRVYLAEELYDGPYATDAPDLIVEPQRENADPDHNYLLDGSVTSVASDIFGLADPYSGNHALEGILIARGPGVGAGKQIKDAFIADIAPTVMAALAAAIPDSLDGHVLTDLFEPGQEPEVTYITMDDQPAAGSATELFNQEESLAVENRLRDLGYLD